jgi:hypothetical protein
MTFVNALLIMAALSLTCSCLLIAVLSYGYAVNGREEYGVAFAITIISIIGFLMSGAWLLVLLT